MQWGLRSPSPSFARHDSPCLIFFYGNSERDRNIFEEIVGGRLGHFVSLDFDCGIHDDRSIADAEKARLVPTTRDDAWAAIEGQGERVIENERGGHRRACILLSYC